MDFGTVYQDVEFLGVEILIIEKHTKKNSFYCFEEAEGDELRDHTCFLNQIAICLLSLFSGLLHLKILIFANSQSQP